MLSDTKRMLLFLPLRSLGLISNAYCLRYFHGSYISEPDDDRIVSHDALRFMLYYHCVRDISSLLLRGLFVLWGGWGEKKERARGARWEGEREKRGSRRFPLPIVLRARASAEERGYVTYAVII